MAGKYNEILFTPGVLEAQRKYFGATQQIPPQPAANPLTEDEIEFIATRDSFYLGTVNRDGWPYIQHRGGRPGFLRVLSPAKLAFADYKGNRQLISTGNLASNNRVSLFLMDYPHRTRLKILGFANVQDARENPELVEQIAEPDVRRIVERIYSIEVVSYDWNCPKYITPRFTEAEIEVAIEPLRKRITQLELELSKNNS